LGEIEWSLSDVGQGLECENSVIRIAKLSGGNSPDADPIVYEPTLEAPDFFNSRLICGLEAFKAEADVIVANRATDELADVADKVFTRHIFQSE